MAPSAQPLDRENFERTAGNLPHGFEIGTRYRVLRLLGKGGMGTVYQVRDLELDRDVALKFIRPELADKPRILERFKREIQLSSQVTHKNVLRVYDLGETNDVKYLTMQYVEGKDLAALLQEGALGISRTIKLFRQICAGLAAAHERGVLHRDLKPQNILVDAEDNVYVTDFGLAKSLDLSGLTESGAVVGTPHYMSPEQVKGETVDVRSDVYALGVMLYEMLAGEVPFSGGSAYEVMVQRVQRDPTPVADLNPETPRYLRKILERCMVVDPDLRYASSDEIVVDLDAETARSSIIYEIRRRRWLRPVALVLLVAVLAGVGWWLTKTLRPDGGETGATAVAEPDVPALGVVPFTNRTGDAALEWYGDGVAQLVIDNVSQSRHVRVVSARRMVSLGADASDVDSLRENAATAGIDFLLAGEILAAPEGVSLAARLIDTGDGVVVATRRVDGLDEQSLISASDAVAAEVRKGLAIPPEEEVDVYAADFVTKKPEAYASFLEGLRAFVSYRHQEAEESFRRALAIAPDYTMARYRLAQVLAVTGRTDEALEQIRRAAGEASHLPDREARYVAAAEAWFTREYDTAIEAYTALLERYPYEVEARTNLAMIYHESGRHQDLIDQVAVLARLEPDNREIWSMRGLAHLALGNFNEAVTDLRRYVELDPGSANGHHLLADAYRSQGELDLAATQYEKALEADPAFHFATTGLAVVNVLRGREGEAERGLVKLIANEQALPRNRIDAAFELASLYRGRGRFTDAAGVLERVDALIAAEGVREAMALAVRGSSLMLAGDREAARGLLDRAVARSPGVPTRYLLFRGLLEVEERRFADARRTASEILENALPPEDPDRTENKAAAYLEGLARLGEGDAEGAIDPLTEAVALSGYEYRIYRVDLARAFLAAGQTDQALAAANRAAGSLDPADPRLDLELDREHARLVRARVRLAMGQTEAGIKTAQELLDRWGDADRGAKEPAEAREIAAAPAVP